MTPRVATTLPIDMPLPESTGAVSAYRTMLAVRRFQEKIGLLVAMGLIAEPPSSVTGKEPAWVAIARVKGPGEIVVATESDSFALALALGTAPSALFAELLGGTRADLTAVGLSAASSPSAAIETARQLASNATCTFLCLCIRKLDAAVLEDLLAPADAGQLPLVTVLNVLAEETSIVPASFAHETVDGLDMARVEQAVATAAGKARTGGGPTLIVVRVPAFLGHVVAANRPSGTKGPAREESDPVARLRCRILAERCSSEAALKAIEKAVRDSITGAVTEARRASNISP